MPTIFAKSWLQPHRNRRIPRNYRKYRINITTNVSTSRDLKSSLQPLRNRRIYRNDRINTKCWPQPHRNRRIRRNYRNDRNNTKLWPLFFFWFLYTHQILQKVRNQRIFLGSSKYSRAVYLCKTRWKGWYKQKITFYFKNVQSILLSVDYLVRWLDRAFWRKSNLAGMAP